MLGRALRCLPSIRPQAAISQQGDHTMIRMISLTVLAPALLAACSMAPHAKDNSPSTIRDGMLVGPNQMTLYVFDRDTAGSGKSVCNGPCATNWPPLMAKANAAPTGDWSVVTRDDGSKQWAYKGRPLYFWAKDTKPGDKTGDGFLNNSWHVARP
jgi:predicted lipoprotein with Yx(FWY)xxD motif